MVIAEFLNRTRANFYFFKINFTFENDLLFNKILLKGSRCWKTMKEHIEANEIMPVWQYPVLYSTSVL